MMTLQEAIDYLKYYTKDSVMNINDAKIPTFIQNTDITKKRYYLLDGNMYIVSEANKTLIALSGIRFHIPPRRKDLRIFRKPLLELIDGGFVDTFLLFINKKFVKWSNIEIVHDSRYNYAIISNQFIDQIDSVDILYIPFKVVYNERYNAQVEGLTTIFAFTKEGLSSAHGPVNISISDQETVYYKNVYSGGGSMINNELDINPLLRTSRNNLILFKDNLLYNELPIDVSILNLINVNDGIAGNYECKLFYNTNSYIIASNINNVANLDLIKLILKGLYTDGSIDIDKLLEEFNFEYDPKSSYVDNVSNITDYIMGYNKSLLNILYSQDDVFFREYSGIEIKSFVKDNILKMPRYRGITDDTYVLLYNNNMIYNHYNTIVYEVNDFCAYMNPEEINDDDKFEIVYFKKVCNIIQDTIINKDDNFIGDDPIHKKDVMLFTNTPESPSFNIDRSSYINYLIESSVIDDTITLNNEFYYGKNLKEVSKRQFRYACLECTAESFKITLPKEFTFCVEVAKYMIFLNGRLIDPLLYKITAMKETNPMTDISIYLYLTAKIGDKIEVIYTPVAFTRINTDLTIDGLGYLNVPSEYLQYPFSKYLYAIYINGKKIYRTQIVDIDSNSVKIIDDIKTRGPITILKFLTPVEEVIDRMDMTSTWDSLIAELSEAEINSMLSHYGNVSDSEEKIESIFSKENIINEIIRDYWMKPNINTGVPFRYDYDTDTFTVKDSGDNYIIPTMDASKYINIIEK